MLAPDQPNQDDTNEHDQGPDEPGHLLQWTRELLNRERAGVDGDTVHADAGEDEEDQNELCKRLRVQDFVDEETETFIVGGRPFRVDAHGGADAAAGDHADTGGDGDAECREPKHFLLGDLFGIVNLVFVSSRF